MLFRPDHSYNFALRGPLVGPGSLGVGVQRHPIEEELDERSEFPSLL